MGRKVDGFEVRERWNSGQERDGKGGNEGFVVIQIDLGDFDMVNSGDLTMILNGQKVRAWRITVVGNGLITIFHGSHDG